MTPRDFSDGESTALVATARVPIPTAAHEARLMLSGERRLALREVGEVAQVGQLLVGERALLHRARQIVDLRRRLRTRRAPP